MNYVHTSFFNTFVVCHISFFMQEVDICITSAVIAYVFYFYVYVCPYMLFSMLIHVITVAYIAI